MSGKILVINSGSSSLKFKIFFADKTGLKEEISGIAERIGLKKSFLKVESGGQESREDFPRGIADHEKALRAAFQKLSTLNFKLSTIAAIGHRVVHGGEEFVRPTIITPKVLYGLKKYNKLAPLHNPVNLLGIKACMKLLPKVPNVAVFDTAFYSTIPDYAYLYAIPYELYRKYKIRRYGFHGISHRYVAEEAAKELRRPLSKLRLITCHLGSGCSITAIKHGKAIETSMGFTPLEGLTMGTRSGDIDPALDLYLMENLKMSAGKVSELLNKKSGLLGISGLSNDMREILTAAGHKVRGFKGRDSYTKEQKRRAKLALRMFVYDIQRYVGQYATIMKGADALVFTAGIGERNATVRKMIMDGLSFLGKVRVLVIPTNEELMIAKETAVCEEDKLRS